MSISLKWENTFPKGYGHTSIAFLKRCPGFEDAKKGDLNAAQFVVSMCVKQNRINELKEQYPNAVLLPILGQNQLPLALAQKIGLPIWLNVRLLHQVSRKFLCAMQRLLHRPVYIGYVQKDLNYIIVDDIITQGGTIAALREFIILQGGAVVAIVSLAYAIGSYAIAPLKKYLIRLFVKFGEYLNCFLYKYGVAAEINELTNSQVKYLLRFASVNNMINKIEQIA